MQVSPSDDATTAEAPDTFPVPTDRERIGQLELALLVDREWIGQLKASVLMLADEIRRMKDDQVRYLSLIEEAIDLGQKNLDATLANAERTADGPIADGPENQWGIGHLLNDD